MLIKKMTLLFLLVSVIASIGIAFADSDDYNIADFNRLLNGDKNLSNAKIEGAKLQCKDFSGVDFSNADLEEADFSNSNLTGANFKHADLEKVNFKGANLTNANFSYADLEEANLKGATILGAIFKQTELEYTTWTDGRVCAEGSIGGCW